MAEARPEECWFFGFAAPEWSVFARLALSRTTGVASWWTLLARPDEPLLLVRDDALAVPKRTLEVRGPGLWADLTCHEPMQRWQVNFEGVTVALDDPNEAAGPAYGDLVPVEFEFEWESVGRPVDRAGGGGYTITCDVYGEAEIGGYGSLAVDASRGWHGHVWDVT